MLVACNGMIRSGSTLQYNMARALVEKMEAGRGEGFFTASQLDGMADKLASWGKDAGLHVLKIHEVHPAFAGMSADGSARILYIHRDIRDVAVSAKNKFRYERDELIMALDKAVATCSEVKKLQGVLWQRYEAVLNDMPAAVREQASCLGLAPDGSIVDEVVRECSIENAGKVAGRLRKSFRARAGFVLDFFMRTSNTYDRETLLHPDHISKNAGAVGAWRTQLTKQESDMITRRYEWWLLQEGYRLS